MAQLESGLQEDGRHPALAPGQILASRYQVVAFLGQGAVGEVYEAEDLELGERIAIKILRPEIAGDERVLQRFKREIQLGRRVTHPNVCRVFDLVKPEGPPGLSGKNGGAFLTMELLRGETLEQRLAREGRLNMAEALPVIGHIAAALAAAHANGVVHRDLKSGNVFLVPNPSGTGSVRAVVTDFGLAWSSIHEDSSAATLTATGELVGSPAYMAPEQVRGEEATPATDVYALGIVMFEMITGELPFVGKSAFYTALKRLQEPAPSPRVHLSDLDPAWETTILRCLERDPAARFPTVRRVVRSLGATKAEEDATSPLSLLPERRRRPIPGSRFRMGIGIAALLALAVLAGLGIAGKLPFRREAPATALQPVTAAVAPVIVPRPSVAVLPFDNLSDPKDGSEGLPLFELLPLELAATGKLRVIPPEEVDRPRPRKGLGADFLVSGAFLADERGEPTRYDVVVRDARTDRQLAILTEAGGAAALENLGRRLRTVLGAGELSAGGTEALRAAIPRPEAARLYAEGLHRLRRFEAPAARDLLRQAAAEDPHHPLVRSALAAAWRDLGYRQEAQREAKQAAALASTLNRENRLAIEARYHEVAREWGEAATKYQEILSAFPDDLEAGLRQAAAQTQGGQSAEAVATLARLRRLPAPLGDDPSIEIAEAEDAAQRRDFGRQRTAAERAIATAKARGDRLLVAEGRMQHGFALIGLRQPGAATSAFEEAKRIFTAAGHPRGTAETLRGLAVAQAVQGQLEQASASYAEMVRIFREIGAEEDVARGLNQTANVYSASGDQGRAESFYKQALAVAHRIGDQRAEAAILHNLAKLTFLRGNLAEAKNLFLQMLALQRAIGYAEGEGAALQGLGTIATVEGDLLAARRHYQQALGVYREINAEKDLAEVFNNLAEVSFARGELAQCRQEREQALDLARRAHREHEAARALGGLGDVLRRQGDLAAARQRYDRSLASYQELKEPLAEAEIQDEIGWTLTLQGELIEALKRFQRALAVAREEKDRLAEAEILSHQGQALSRYGEAGPALAAQRQSVEICRDLKQAGSRAEALTGLGHVQLAQGDLAAAQESFEQALATFRQRGERGGIASALYGLGETLFARNELEHAVKRHQEALGIRVDMGEKLAAAESRLALARIALAKGEAASAETAASQEVSAFRKLANAPGEAAATLLLVRSLLAQGKTAEARKTLQGAARLLDASQEPAVRQATAELRSQSKGV